MDVVDVGRVEESKCVLLGVPLSSVVWRGGGEGEDGIDAVVDDEEKARRWWCEREEERERNGGRKRGRTRVRLGEKGDRRRRIGLVFKYLVVGRR